MNWIAFPVPAFAAMQVEVAADCSSGATLKSCTCTGGLLSCTCSGCLVHGILDA